MMSRDFCDVVKTSRDFCDVVKTSRDNDFQYSAFVFVNAKWDEVSKKG